MKILITGGCGFIGSNLAAALKEDGHSITCFDNLSRRGSEILRERIREYGCRFVKGDIRNKKDLARLAGNFDLMIECSAEPSVLVGSKGRDAWFMVENNLVGSVNCFEFCRENSVPVIFLSTSRVYPYNAINSSKFRELPKRYEYAGKSDGISKKGVSTNLPLKGYRSLYGATKLASEFILQEYSYQYGIPAIINRCGVVAGPWQLGKADQGVFTYWMASHYFKKPLRYIGFGGKGKQVRDLVHIDDLAALIRKQIKCIKKYKGDVFNVGGSRFSSLSLAETTELCRMITGNIIPVGRDLRDRPADVRWFITDNGTTEREFGWRPRKRPEVILTDIYCWLLEHGGKFKKTLVG
jgi:CDP-paratose 2-epimerase